MTLLSMALDVCDLVGIERPTSVATTAQTQYAQLRAVIGQAVADLAQRHDWRVLYRFQSVPSDSAPLAPDHARFASPEALRRLNVDALFKGTIGTANLFTDPASVQRVEIDYDRLVEGSYVYPNGEARGNACIRVYISRDVIFSGAGAALPRWASDSDVSALPESLIVLSAVWRWKAGKGFAYAEDMSNCEREFERLASADAALGSFNVAEGRPFWADPYTTSTTPSGPINAASVNILASGGYGG